MCCLMQIETVLFYSAVTEEKNVFNISSKRFFPSVKSKPTSLLRACVLDADMNFRFGFVEGKEHI